jgi:hypothetical protein
LSVKPSQKAGAVVEKNADLSAAEQLFLSILVNNSNHANAKYSLAVLYQKTGETDNARLMINSLLETVTDAATQEAVRKQFSDILK